MKVIGRVAGISAVREAQEEYMPERPPPVQDIISAIRSTYQFASFPVFAPGMPLDSPWVFAGGRFTEGKQTFAIAQLVMLRDGDIVATTSTADSDLVLQHLCNLMVEKFGYRLESANKKHNYVSTIVVEFDFSFNKAIAKIAKIEQIIAENIQSRLPFKGIMFGADSVLAAQNNPLLRIETTDFSIERRIGHAENRYFCNAPMTTDEHIRVLEEIEAIAREGCSRTLGQRPAKPRR